MLVVCLLHLADPEEAHGRSSILDGRGEQGDDACLQIIDFAWIAVRTLPALDVARAAAALLQHIPGISECGIAPQLVQVHLGIAPIKPKHHHGPRPDAEPEGAPPGWGRTATKETLPTGSVVNGYGAAAAIDVDAVVVSLLLPLSSLFSEIVKT